jgi:hypothetical protein
MREEGGESDWGGGGERESKTCGCRDCRVANLKKKRQPQINTFSEKLKTCVQLTHTDARVDNLCGKKY